MTMAYLYCFTSDSCVVFHICFSLFFLGKYPTLHPYFLTLLCAHVLKLQSFSHERENNRKLKWKIIAEMHISARMANVMEMHADDDSCT